jgi:hypothetical protein
MIISLSEERKKNISGRLIGFVGVGQRINALIYSHGLASHSWLTIELNMPASYKKPNDGLVIINKETKDLCHHQLVAGTSTSRCHTQQQS